MQICSGTVRARRHTTSGLRLFSGDLPRPCRRLAAAVPELHRVRHSPHDPQADCCDRSSWEHRLDDLHPSGHEHPAECQVDDHGRSDQDHRRLVGHSGQKLHRHAAPRRHQEMTKAPASLPELPALQLNSTSTLRTYIETLHQTARSSVAAWGRRSILITVLATQQSARGSCGECRTR